MHTNKAVICSMGAALVFFLIGFTPVLGGDHKDDHNKTDNKLEEESKPLKKAEPVAPEELGYLSEPGWRPPGFVGGRRRAPDLQSDFLPIPDRWRIALPPWERYVGGKGEYPYSKGAIWNPYNQNVIKGDYPIVGDEIFLLINAISDTIFEAREVPTPSGVPFRRAPNQEFFGDPQAYFLNENIILSFEVFKGSAAFKPRDWELRITPVFNINYVHFEENNNVDIDTRKDNTRTDTHIAFQELFFEKHLGDLTHNYDFWSFRGGIQAFTSDFRGFVYLENQPGARLFGNYNNNLLNWNLAYFRFIEKNSNSGLNEIFNDRHQDVFIANVFRQDFIWPGFTIQFSYLYNNDRGDGHIDDNGFLRRPSPVGDRSRNKIRAHYLGVNSEGHIGRFNLSTSYYFVFGEETHNPIAQKELSLSAFMLAFEPSIDFDWIRIKGNFFYASGDEDPEDDKGEGFDSIVDNPNFAGAGASYFQRQGIGLGDTFIFLKGRNSLLPNLRSAKNEGQANFVNPGLILTGIGFDVRVTQKWRADININHLMFDRPSSVELVLFQRQVNRQLAMDYSVGVQYRPLLTDNIIINFGAAILQPFEGFQDIYEKKGTLFSTFIGLTLVY